MLYKNIKINSLSKIVIMDYQINHAIVYSWFLYTSVISWDASWFVIKFSIQDKLCTYSFSIFLETKLSPIKKIEKENYFVEANTVKKIIICLYLTK